MLSESYEKPREDWYKATWRNHKAQIPDHVDCDFKSYTLSKQPQESTIRISKYFSLIDGIAFQEKLLKFNRHGFWKLFQIVGEKFLRFLMVEDMMVEGDDTAVEVEHLQDDFDEFEAFEDLLGVVFAAVVFEDFYGEEASDYAVAEVLFVLEF